LLERPGQGIAEELAALVEGERLAAVQQAAVRGRPRGALQFHGQGEGLLDDLALEV
jgi:hypothetical protein